MRGLICFLLLMASPVVAQQVPNDNSTLTETQERWAERQSHDFPLDWLGLLGLAGLSGLRRRRKETGL